MAVAPDHERLARVRSAIDREDDAERDHRDRVPSALDEGERARRSRRRAGRLDQRAGQHVEDLVDRGRRDHEGLRSTLEREHVHDRDRDRDPEREGGPDAELRHHRDLASEVTDRDPAHDVHAQPAAARRARRVSRGEARGRQDLEERHVVVDGAARTPGDRRAVDAAAVIADNDLEVVADDRDAGHADRAGRGFAERDPLLGRLDRVIHRVANEMDQRGQQAIRDRLVELGVEIAAIELELHGPVDRTREAPDEEREGIEDLGDLDEACAQDRATKIAEQAALDARGLLDGDLAIELEPRDDQQRQLVLERVEPGELDTDHRSSDRRYVGFVVGR